jgi:hypothetical protein
VRRNFVYGREFLGDADLNAQAITWLEHTANRRVHGTTHEVPCERFERDEHALLQPLAARPYQSLVLPPQRLARSSPIAGGLRPHVLVERRPLAAYMQLMETER